MKFEDYKTIIVKMRTSKKPLIIYSGKREYVVENIITYGNKSLNTPKVELSLQRIGGGTVKAMWGNCHNKFRWHKTNSIDFIMEK